MNVQERPAYLLGNAPTAEARLGLLDQITCPPFVDAVRTLLPHRNVRVLILGSGSGHLEEGLSKFFSESCFVGIDISAKRIEEARARTGALQDTNTYEYIEADLTSVELKDLKPFDILMSRFVLSHLQHPLEQLERYFPLVRAGGYVCLEEAAFDESQYYCNNDHPGYREFVKMVRFQIQAQQSSFKIGFTLLSQMLQRPGKVLHTHLTQPLLRTAEEKAILRLGAEDAKPGIFNLVEEEKLEEIIECLRDFERDDKAYGLYARSLALIFQTPALE